ncbi:MAG: cadherin-like beta sandwich domain-containing protein [Anaeroplasmataceae bacterium]|nr:cadherin-like beta sandwich domain-containing protein [Anaeroplasmataceae bacterium]
MKIIDKFKRIVLLLTLAIGLILTGYGIKLSVNAESDPAGRPVITYHYSAYKKDAYEAYLDAKIVVRDGDLATLDEVKSIIATYEALPTGNTLQQNKKKNFFTSGDGSKYNEYYNIPKLPNGEYDYDNADGPYNRGTTSEDVYAALKAEVAAFEANLEAGAVTKLVAGQEIVIAVTATTSDNTPIYTSQVVLDLNGIMTGTPTFYNSKDTLGNSLKVANKMQGDNRPLLGQGFDRPQTGVLPYPAFVGAVGFTVSNTATTTTVKMDKVVDPGQTLFGVSSINGTINMDTYADNFAEDTLELKGAAVSDKVGLTQLDVNSVDALKGNSAGPSYTGTNSTSSADVKIKVEDDGTIESTGYVYTTQPTVPASGTAAAPAGSTSTVNITSGIFNYNMSSVGAGKSVWVLFKAVSSSGKVSKWYMVELPKAKSNDCNLEKVIINGDTKELLNKTETDLASTKDYTVYYPKGTSTFTLTPTFIKDDKTAKVQGNTVTSGSVVTLTGISNNTVVPVVVTAQDGTTSKTYNFTFVEANTAPTAVVAKSGPAGGIVTVNGVYSSSPDTYTMDNMCPGRSSFGLTITLPSGASAVLKDSSGGSSTLKDPVVSGVEFTINYDTPVSQADTATTKTMILTVTNAGVSQNYVLVVNRPAADKDMDIEIINLTYVKPDGSTDTYSLPATPTLSGSTRVYTTTAKLPYNSTKANFTIQLKNASSKSKILDQTLNDINGVPKYLDLPTGPSDLSEEYLFYVQTEYDRAQGKTGTVCKIVIEEENPSTDKNKTDLHIEDTSGTTIPAKTTNDTTRKYTYEIDTSTYGDKFTVVFDWTPKDKAKAYAGTTSNPSVEYSASTQYNVGDTVYVKLVAENGSYDIYEIVTSKGKNSITDIEDIVITATVNGTTKIIFNGYNKTTYNYDYTMSGLSDLKVPYGTTSISYTVTLKDAKSTLVVDGKDVGPANSTTRTSTRTLTAGDNNIAFKCRAENGTDGSTYSVHVFRTQANTGNLLTELEIGGYDCSQVDTTKYPQKFDPNTNSFSIYLPCTQGNTKVKLGFSDGAKGYVSIVNGSSFDYSSEFNFTNSIAHGNVYTFTVGVASEKELVDKPTNPTRNTYTIKVYVGSQDKDLTKLDGLKSAGAAYLQNMSGGIVDINNYASYTSGNPFKVPYATENIYIDAAAAVTFHGVIKYNNTTNALVPLAEGLQPITVRVESEIFGLDSTRTDLVREYTFYVERQACDNDKTLQSLDVLIDGVPTAFKVPFNPSVTVYNIENLTTGGTITINAKANSDTSKISGQTGTQNITGLDYTDLTTQTTETFTVTVTCACGKNSQDYKIILSTKAYEKNTNPGAITSISATTNQSGTKEALERVPSSSDTPVYNQGVYNYEVHLTNKDNDDTVVFNISKDNDKSTLHFKEGTNDKTTTLNTAQFTVSGVNYDETRQIEVKVVAEDGTEPSVVYRITIKRDSAPSTDNKLLSIKYNGTTPVPGFDPEKDGPYTVHLKTANDVYFTVEKSDANSTVSTTYPDSYSNRYIFAANEFSKTFAITVTPEKGTSRTYTIIVDRDDAMTLEELHALVAGTDELDPGFNKIITDYSVLLNSKQGSVTLRYVPSNANTTIQILDPSGTVVSTSTSYIVNNIQPTMDSNGNNDNPLVYTIRVTAASGAKQDYTVAISKQRGSDVVYIDSYMYKESATDATEKALDGLNPTDRTYSYRVDRNVTYFNPTITLNDPDATYKITSSKNLVAGRKNEINIEVTSASGDTVEYYTFNVYPCDITYTIDEINALVADQSGHLLSVDTPAKHISYVDGVLEITVPYGKAAILNTYLKVTATADNYTVFLNGSEMKNAIQNLVVGRNTFNLQVKSEYATVYEKETGIALSGYSSTVVPVVIIRKDVGHDATLKELYVTYMKDGVEHKVVADFLPNNSTLTLPFLGDNVTIVSITAVPNDPQASVTGDGTKTLTDGTPDASGNYNFTVTCTAEDGTTKLDYPISIARDAIDLNKDNSILEIIVEAGGKTYLASPDFKPETTEYGVFKIPFNAQNYTITVRRPDGTYSTTWIDGAPRTSNNLTTTITDAMRGTSKNVPVYCVAQDSEVGKGKEYTIKLEFEEASTDSSLANLKADGTTVPGFSPSVLEYELPARPNGTQVIEFEYTTTDPKSTVSGDIGRQPLKEGDNYFTITVRAEDGSTTAYKIHVVREYPLPYLTDLLAVGEKLLDADYKTTTFDKEVYYYTTIVSYMTLHATINASVDNKDFVVTCSNSTVNSKTDFLRAFDVDLAEGKNEFTITVTSLQGKSVEYHLTIKRRGEASTNTDVASIEILQIPEFKTDYTNDIREYTYDVPNGIKSLDVVVHPEKVADSDGDGATYKIINGRDSGKITEENVDLRVGKNTLVVLVIAEDGETTRAIIVEVNRAPISFTVDTEAYENYTCTKKETGEYAYHINLGNKRAADIEDYTKYIVFDEDSYDSKNEYVELPEVTVISDTSNKQCNEVIVRIYDGDEEIFVTFELESSALGGSSIPEILQIIMPWILLAIAIIILIIILICVNRDKFGAINKKRKKDDEQEA